MLIAIVLHLFLAAELDWTTPVLNAAMCPLTKDPWDCGRQQAGRMLDVFIADVELTKQKIKGKYTYSTKLHRRRAYLIWPGNNASEILSPHLFALWCVVAYARTVDHKVSLMQSRTRKANALSTDAKNGQSSSLKSQR